MKPPTRYLFFAILLVCIQQRSSHAQTIQVAVAATNDGQGGYLTQWDAVQKKLLLYRDTKMASVPAARMYAADGSEVVVFPVKDLQDSWYVDIWGVAATPRGGMVLAAGVGYTPHGVRPAEEKPFLLTYDGTGKLQRAWEVWPYQYFEVAVDSAGNVFGLGLREGDSPYPLIVKYSSTGKILKEFFSTSLLPAGEDSFHANAQNGRDQMFIAGNDLFFWLATTKELFRFSLDGDLVARTNFKSALDSLTRKSNAANAAVQQLSTDESGQIVAQIVFWSLDTSVRHPFVLLSRFGSDGQIQEMSPLAPPSKTSSFLWASKNGRNMYLDYDANAKVTKLAEH